MRRINYIFLLAVVLFSCDRSIDEFQSHNFIKYFGSGYESVGYDVIELSDGSYVITGYDNEGETNSQIYAAKVDENGNWIWRNTYGTSGKDETGKRVKEVSDGYIIAGTSSSADTIRSFILKLGEGGDSLWYKEYGDSAHNVQINDILVEEGSIFVAGLAYSLDTNFVVPTWNDSSDYYLAKLSLDGDVDWEWTYFLNTESSFEKVYLRGSNLLYIGYAGYQNRIVLQTIVKSSGTPLGSYFLETTGEKVADATLIDDQAVILANTSTYTKLIKLVANNSEEWHTETIASIRGKAFAITTDSLQIVAGESGAIANSLINTIRVDGNGKAEYGPENFRTLPGSIECVKKTADGGVIMIGSTNATFGKTIQLIKTGQDLFLLKP